jgi:predicted ferric reductase
VIPGIVLLAITVVAAFAGGSVTSVLGVQALALLIWTGALGIAIRRKWPTGAASETVNSHKWCAAAAVFLMTAHAIAAVVTDPMKYRYFIPFEAPPPGAAAVGALTMGVVTYSLGHFRKRVKMLPSARWKFFHGLCAVTAALLGMTHVVWLGNLIYSPLWQVAFILLFIGCAVLVTVRLR